MGALWGHLRGQARLEEDRHCKVPSLVPETMEERPQLRLLTVLPLLSVCLSGTSPHKKGHGHSHTGFLYLARCDPKTDGSG